MLFSSVETPEVGCTGSLCHSVPDSHPPPSAPLKMAAATPNDSSDISDNLQRGLRVSVAGLFRSKKSRLTVVLK